MFMLRFAIILVATSALVPMECYAQVQDSKDRTQAERREAVIQGYVARIIYDKSLGRKLKLTLSQKEELSVLIAEMHEGVADRSLDQQIDIDALKRKSSKFSNETKRVLGEKQWKQLEKLADKELALQIESEQKNASQAASIKEVSRMNRLLAQFTQISYDKKKAEDLGVTNDQLVEIQRVRQEFQRTVGERAKNSDTGQFDMDSYRRAMEDLLVDAQAILTLEQTEKLEKSAALTQMRGRYGDVFEMVNGIADDFEIAPADKERLKQKIEDARDRFYAKLDQLQNETLKEIVKELPKSRQSEVEASLQQFMQKDPRTNNRRGF